MERFGRVIVPRRRGRRLVVALRSLEREEGIVTLKLGLTQLPVVVFVLQLL